MRYKIIYTKFPIIMIPALREALEAVPDKTGAVVTDHIIGSFMMQSPRLFANYVLVSQFLRIGAPISKRITTRNVESTGK